MDTGHRMPQRTDYLTPCTTTTPCRGASSYTPSWSIYTRALFCESMVFAGWWIRRNVITWHNVAVHVTLSLPLRLMVVKWLESVLHATGVYFLPEFIHFSPATCLSFTLKADTPGVKHSSILSGRINLLAHMQTLLCVGHFISHHMIWNECR